ncbi:hypothetical protein SLS60_002224 [Paraconiothyrium brasiliense]|uniref:Delta 8-(E)-sphingolipid desaturase n=1 Tax=Paraconiothyrium brasiliense TaxID=300254 RepID=A0ABR3S1L0_9PLEO
MLPKSPYFFDAAEISRLIAHDQVIVIHEGHVLNLTTWINKHPGGRLAILHMVGRDATDEININVDSSAEIVAARERYATDLEQKEIADGLRDNPSIDYDTQRAIALEYRGLHQRIKAEGLYACRYSEYAKESIRYAILFSSFLYLLHVEWYLTSALALGLFWQQIMFTAHDAAHCGITANFTVDTLIGAFIADFCCGLSIGWWKSSHNVHHLITNDPIHDPDIQNIPLFSNSPTYMKSILSSFYNFRFVWDSAADFLIPYQKYTYYPVMALARFNLYMLSWLHLVSPRAAQLGAAWWTRPVEILFMACYWFLFGYCLVWCTLPTWPIRIGFVLLSHMVTMLLHVQITLSHWGMPTADLGPTESFAQRQLRTTMDVDCPAWLDFLHGGLQFQAVHHLFPRVPRHNLRQVQSMVREFCDKTEIRYQCYGFVQGNGIVLSRLEEVAKMVTTLVECQKHMAETGESGLH